MDIVEATVKRVSCRAFTRQAIEPEKVAALEGEIARINEESGLSFQLYGPREDGTAIDLFPKLFATNSPLYAAFVAQEGPLPEEKLGYYGEQFVLAATQLGLGTCWVAGTYDHETVRVELAEGEKLHDVIPIGYAMDRVPIKQRTFRGGLRARNKQPEALWQGPTPLAEAPAWVASCIDAVIGGPSACNGQPVVFVQEGPDAPITAKISCFKYGLEFTDLGIAKLHFEIAARACGVPGSWEWGDGGAFVLE